MTRASNETSKRDLKDLGINTNTGEAVAADRDAWKCGLQKALTQFEVELMRQAEEKRFQRKA